MRIQKPFCESHLDFGIEGVFSQRFYQRLARSSPISLANFFFRLFHGTALCERASADYANGQNKSRFYDFVKRHSCKLATVEEKTICTRPVAINFINIAP